MCWNSFYVFIQIKGKDGKERDSERQNYKKEIFTWMRDEGLTILTLMLPYLMLREIDLW